MYQTYEALKRKKGVTDYEVAQNTGISTATLSNWKAGRYTPKLDKIMKICDYFGVSIDEFLKGGEK